MTWRPIDTAPRDGTMILCWSTIWAGEISNPDEREGLAYVAYYASGKSDYLGEWWNVHGGDAYSAWIQPTHWMPLPTPPEGKE